MHDQHGAACNARTIVESVPSEHRYVCKDRVLRMTAGSPANSNR